MRDFIISTDSTADLPESYIKEHNICIHPLYYTVDGVTYGGDSNMPLKTFFDKMRAGSATSTSATNPDFIMKTMTEQVEAGYDILHIGFSSGLSCSFNNAFVAAQEIKEQHPEARIEVIDSLSASMGQGLVVYYAVKMKEEGKSMDEIVTWINENRLHVCHQFTVDDLKYLARGGRISKTVAIIGTIVNVKPVLHVDDEGHLIPLANVRGRKKAIQALVDNMAAQVGEFKNEIVLISHGDCLSDAELLRDMIKERFGIESFMIDYISPTVGSHSGPGTLALFHLGNTRKVQ